MNFKEGMTAIYEEAVTCFGEERVDINVHSNLFFLYIYFPNFTIKNSKGLSHDISDLYVKLEFNRNLHLKFFYGTRTSISYEEKCIGYIHSHLESNFRLGHFTPFCTGSSIMSGFMSTLCNELDLNTLSAFLFSLEEMLAWESLEGTPHIHMRNLSSKRELNSLNFSKEKGDLIYKLFLRELSNFKYNLNVNLTDLKLDFDKKSVEDILTRILSPSYTEYLCEYSEGNYYSKTTNNSTHEENLGETDWYFKGKKLPVKISPSKIDIKTTLISHPELTTFIYEKFLSEFQEYLEKTLKTA